MFRRFTLALRVLPSLPRSFTTTPVSLQGVNPEDFGKIEKKSNDIAEGAKGCDKDHVETVSEGAKGFDKDHGVAMIKAMEVGFKRDVIHGIRRRYRPRSSLPTLWHFKGQLSRHPGY